MLLAVRGSEPFRGYVQNIEDGSIKAFTEPGIGFIHSRLIILTSDGRFATFLDPAGRVRLYPLDGGQPIPIPGLKDEEYRLLWMPDARNVVVSSGRSRGASSAWNSPPAGARRGRW